MARPEDLKRGYYCEVDVLPLEFFEIGGDEGFDYETGRSDTAEFTAVADAAESGWKNIGVLEPHATPTRHVVYVLWGVEDGCRYYLKVATGTNRLGVDEDKDVGFVDNLKSPRFDPSPRYAFWLVNDYFPALNADNDTGYSLTPKVYFTGTKWDLFKVTDPSVLAKLRTRDVPSVKITIGGVKD